MKKFNKLIALLMAIVLTLSLVGCSNTGVSGEDGTESVIEQSINAAGKYLVKKTTKPQYGDEKIMIAILRSGYIDYWHNRATVYGTTMDSMISSNGGKVGEKGNLYAEAYPSVIEAYTAIGIYADKTANADLLRASSYDNIVMQGGYLNKINTLTALECGDYTLSESGDLTKEILIDFILSLQKTDGSFRFSGMTETPIKVTASAVTALALTDQDERTTTAIEQGTDYLITHIRKDDSFDDISNTIIALNTAGISARDVEGNDLVQWIIDRQRTDGSFAEDESAKKGDKYQTADALLGLSSQYRFENGQTSLYDMTDVVGATHNKLSPGWSLYLNIMKVFLVLIILFLIYMLVVSRIRIKKWREEGVYNEKSGRMMTDAEIARRDAELAKEKNDTGVTSEENIEIIDTPAEKEQEKIADESPIEDENSNSETDSEENTAE